MSSCSDYPTANDAKRFKNNADSTNEFVTSQDNTFTDQDGGVHNTINGIDQLASDQRDNFEVSFSSQFNFKRIGNISDYAGQSLPAADKLNSYQFPDDSGDWYVPEQGQSFPITIPADPAVPGSNWFLQSPSGVYRGLWPDAGGSANKGETWQTQTGGTPTGQYFTALQNTIVDPVSDDVNWRSVVSFSSVINPNLISNSSFEVAGSVTNPPDATPITYNAGDELFKGMFAVGALTGVTYIDGKLNGTGQLYTDVYKSEKQKDSTANYLASIASSNGIPLSSGASFVDNGDYWRITFDMIDTFSVKFEQGSVATGHEVSSLSQINLWKDQLDVRGWGAVDGVDSTQAAIAMLAETMHLSATKNFNLVCSNVLVPANAQINLGKLTLPDTATSDGDRILYNLIGGSGIAIDVDEVDGGKFGRTGDYKTQLLEFSNCPDINIRVKKLHGNYCPRAYSAPNERGPLWVSNSPRAIVSVDYMTDWAREGVYVESCDGSTVYLGYGLGTDQEFSGVQMSGDKCTLLYAKVENAGASSISFDVSNGIAGKLISINPRFFNGVNLGHAGIPCNNSVIDSIVSLDANESGLNFGAGSTGTVVSSVNIDGSGLHGINQSDGATKNQVLGGVSKNSASDNCRVFSSELLLSNIDLSIGAGNLPIGPLTGTGSIANRTHVRLSSDPLRIEFHAISGTSTTILNGNIKSDQIPIMSPANAAAAGGSPYIASIAEGSMVVETLISTGGGAGVRIDIT